ncbi:3039_t:CDS:2, partial [Funneliformis geosporum]
NRKSTFKVNPKIKIGRSRARINQKSACKTTIMTSAKESIEAELECKLNL